MADLLNGDAPSAEQNNGTAADPAAPAAPAATNEGGGAPASAAPQASAPAAPEPFTLADLKVAEGVTVAESDFKALGEMLGEGFTKEAAQKFIDFETTRQQSLMKAIQEENDKQLAAWEEAAKADKDFGGDKFDENLAAAQEALGKLGTPELQDMLKQTGLGSHPEVIRLFVKLAPLVREERPGTGGLGGGQEPSRLELLYGKTN